MVQAYLTFDPRIPLALWVLLAGAVCALLVAYAVLSRKRIHGPRRVGMLVLMGLAVALPLAMLLNPTWIEQLPPPAGKPLLTILVDASASMATADVGENQTRHASATQIARDTEKRLSHLFETRVRSFAAGASDQQESNEQSPRGQSTDLAQALEDSFDHRPEGHAMLLLSDGIHNAGGGAARVRQSVEKARAMALPIYTMTLGGQSDVRDLEVALALPQEMAFVGQQIPVTATVRQRGAVTDRASISLLLDDKVIESREIRLQPDELGETTFYVSQPKSGLYRYVVRAEPHTAEVTAINNNATLALRVIDEPVKVLLLEGKPYWDTKFLLRTLSMDRSIELTSIVRLAEGRYLERRITRPPATAEKDAPADAPPTDEVVENEATDESTKETTLQDEQWKIRADAEGILADAKALAEYQIVILGRDAEIYLTESSLARVKNWLVEEEGSLVCSRGAPSSQVSQRLGELMPVGWAPGRESRFRVQFTESGQSLHWLPSAGGEEEVLPSLPSLATVARPERAKPLAVVLATASGQADENEPVITYQPVGNGRVVVVEGSGMWRWAFLPPQHQQHDEVYGLLWRSLVRWLVTNVGLLPSQQLALHSDKTTFNVAEVAGATLLVRPGYREGEVPEIELVGPENAKPQTFVPIPAGAVPGQFRVVFGKLPEGVYQARVKGGAETDGGTMMFDVHDSFDEQLNVAARPDLMQLIAEQSGGDVFNADAPDALAQKFEEHLAATLPQRTQRTTAWDRWWVLLMVFGLWAASWGLRRSSGLV